MLKAGQGEACFSIGRIAIGMSAAAVSASRRLAEDRCFAQLSSHRTECKARRARVCGWKARADFCPTERCATWLWSNMRPTVIHLFRRDVVRQAISHAIARHTNVWTCTAASVGACHTPAQPKAMATKVLATLAWLRRKHRSRCRYMELHVPRPWHEVAYEDLSNATTRAAAVAAIYRTLGVNVSFGRWRDTRRRQSSYEATSKSVMGAAEYAKLQSQLAAGNVSVQGMSSCETLPPALLRRRTPRRRLAEAVGADEKHRATSSASSSSAMRACSSCGVMHCVYLNDPGSGGSSGHARTVTEAIASAEQLRRRMRPAYPLMLFANEPATALIQSRSRLGLWDTHRSIRLPASLGATLRRIPRAGAPSPFAFKLAAMLATDWEHTLFLDNDLLVLEPSLVHSLLNSTLKFADLAAPVVPGRHKMLGAALSATAPGAPLLCSCLMAYRRQALPLLLEAASSLLLRAEPSLGRQGDQEYMWLGGSRRAPTRTPYLSNPGVVGPQLRRALACPRSLLQRGRGASPIGCACCHCPRITTAPRKPFGATMLV